MITKCNKSFDCFPYIIKSGEGKYCSNSCKGKYNWSNPEYRKRMSDAHKGKESPKKGKRYSNRLQTEKHRGAHYYQWAQAVKRRDFFKCRIQGADCCEEVVAHHILSFRDYPELRFVINNGITLCKKHHPLKFSEEERLSPYFQQLVKTNI